MTAGLFYRLAEFQERILGGDPIEPATVTCPPCDGRGVLENDGHGEWWLTCTTCEGLGVVDPATVEPDELTESRPVDVDDCSSCGGDGLVEVIDWMVTGLPVDVTCTRCGGTGQRGAA